MNVAVLCEFSGVVRDAFIRAGHDAVSCDLLDTTSPGPHIVGDCLAQNWAGIDLFICHPPCTRLCNSGVRWLHERDLWAAMRDAAQFFKACHAIGDRNACENPTTHRYARKLIGRPSFAVQPWQFGDNFKKRTCFWTRGLPALIPTSTLDGSTAVAQCHSESPGPDRWKRRSVTYQGIADAMADQWGSI